MTPTTQPAEHTKEPWLTGEPEIGFTHDIDNHVYPGLPEQDLALLPLNDYRRAIACVNALAGIPAPESAIEQARLALEEAGRLLVIARTVILECDPDTVQEFSPAMTRGIATMNKALSNLTPATDKQG